MKGLRGFSVGLCGILCVAGLVFGIAYTYASRVVFSSSVASNRLAESLADPRVASVVATEVVDQIVESHRDLTPYRPVLLGAVESVVSSAPFRTVVRRAARQLHESLLNQTAHDLILTAEDLGIIVRNAVSMYPQIAEKVPAKTHVVFEFIEKSGLTGKALVILRIGQRFRQRAIVLLAAGLLLGACGLLLARRKDRYLLRFGLGLATVSFLLASIARFGGEGAALLAKSPAAADLVRGVWAAFFRPLTINLLVLAGIGLVLVAAVTSLLERLDLEALGRGLWRRFAKPQPRAGWKIARGALLTLAGLAAILHPAQSIAVLVVICGVVLFFFGIQEIFITAVRFTSRVEQAFAGRQKKKRRPSHLPAAVVAALVVVFAAAGAIWLAGRDDAVADVSSSIAACNGYPELCDRPLNDVAFATTHNSMAAAEIRDWMFPNQERGLRAQLEDGVRGFLIDIHYGVPVKDRIKTLIENEEASRRKYEAILGKEGVEAAMRIRERLIGEPQGKQDVYLCHGFCELGATRFISGLEEMRNFLIINPNEVLIIILQDEGVAPEDVAACFAKSGFERFVYRGSVMPPWPTLREMIERDERVLVLAENNAEGAPWYHPAFEVVQETPYGFKSTAEFSNVPNRGGTAGSLFLMNHWVETTPAPLPSSAAVVNATGFLLERARACRKERGLMPNLIAVDFYRTGDLLEVVRTLNGVNRPPSEPER